MGNACGTLWNTRLQGRLSFSLSRTETELYFGACKSKEAGAALCSPPPPLRSFELRVAASYKGRAVIAPDDDLDTAV